MRLRCVYEIVRPNTFPITRRNSALSNAARDISAFMILGGVYGTVLLDITPLTWLVFVFLNAQRKTIIQMILLEVVLLPATKDISQTGLLSVVVLVAPRTYMEIRFLEAVNKVVQALTSQIALLSFVWWLAQMVTLLIILPFVAWKNAHLFTMQTLQQVHASLLALIYGMLIQYPNNAKEDVLQIIMGIEKLQFALINAHNNFQQMTRTICVYLNALPINL